MTLGREFALSRLPLYSLASAPTLDIVKASIIVAVSPWLKGARSSEGWVVLTLDGAMFTVWTQSLKLKLIDANSG